MSGPWDRPSSGEPEGEWPSEDLRAPGDAWTPSEPWREPDAGASSGWDDWPSPPNPPDDYLIDEAELPATDLWSESWTDEAAAGGEAGWTPEPTAPAWDEPASAPRVEPWSGDADPWAATAPSQTPAYEPLAETPPARAEEPPAPAAEPPTQAYEPPTQAYEPAPPPAYEPAPPPAYEPPTQAYEPPAPAQEPPAPAYEPEPAVAATPPWAPTPALEPSATDEPEPLLEPSSEFEAPAWTEPVREAPPSTEPPAAPEDASAWPVPPGEAVPPAPTVGSLPPDLQEFGATVAEAETPPALETDAAEPPPDLEAAASETETPEPQSVGGIQVDEPEPTDADTTAEATRRRSWWAARTAPWRSGRPPDDETGLESAEPGALADEAEPAPAAPDAAALAAALLARSAPTPVAEPTGQGAEPAELAAEEVEAAAETEAVAPAAEPEAAAAELAPMAEESETVEMPGEREPVTVEAAAEEAVAEPEEEPAIGPAEVAAADTDAAAGEKGAVLWASLAARSRAEDAAREIGVHLDAAADAETAAAETAEAEQPVAAPAVAETAAEAGVAAAGVAAAGVVEAAATEKAQEAAEPGSVPTEAEAEAEAEALLRAAPWIAAAPTVLDELATPAPAEAAAESIDEIEAPAEEPAAAAASAPAWPDEVEGTHVLPSTWEPARPAPRETSGELEPEAGPIKTTFAQRVGVEEEPEATPTTAEQAVPWLIGVILLLAGMVIVLLALIFAGDTSLGGAAPDPSGTATPTASPTAASPRPTPSSSAATSGAPSASTVPTPTPLAIPDYGPLEMVYLGRSAPLAHIFLLHHDFTVEGEPTVLAQDPDLDVQRVAWAPDGRNGVGLYSDLLISVEPGTAKRRLADGISTVTYGRDPATLYAVRVTPDGANDVATVVRFDFASGDSAELASVTYARPSVASEDALPEAQFIDEGGPVRIFWMEDDRLRLWVLGAGTWTIDPADGAVSEAETDLPVLWSPRGNRRVTVAEEGTTTTLTLLDGSGESLAVTTVAGLVSHLRWSPDGDRVVFTVGRSASGGGVLQDLFLWDLGDGEAPVQLTATGAAFSAEWLGTTPLWRG